jgi:hypothetical protein
VNSTKDRRLIRQLVAELAARLHAPGGFPAWRDVVAVAIPRQVAARLLRSGRLQPGRAYRIELGGGRCVVAGGGALRAVCRALVSLADAQAAGDEPGARRALEALGPDQPRTAAGIVSREESFRKL